MSKEIYNTVKDTVYNYGTSNPFEICKKKGMKVKFVNYGKAIILGEPANAIFINEKYDEASRYILCAHELGHLIFHKNDVCNHYNENDSLLKMEKDKEANLFAVYLLFDDRNLDIKFANMNSYLLQNFMEDNLNII